MDKEAVAGRSGAKMIRVCSFDQYNRSNVHTLVSIPKKLTKIKLAEGRGARKRGQIYVMCVG